jgi:uncharacterized membrane protein
MFKFFCFLIIFLYIFYLPGYLLTRVYLKKTDALSRAALSFAISMILIPISAFGFAMALRVTVGINILILAATVINAFCAPPALKKKSVCPLSKE